MSKKHEIPLLPIFDEFDFKDRAVYICFDSDAATNPDVVGAERKLAERLLDRGAQIFIIRLPPNEEGGKNGLDDYIMAQGVDAFTALVETAEPFTGSEMLHELNERVTYVRNPGFIWDHSIKMRLSPSAFTEHAYSDWTYQEVTETKNTTSMKEVSAPHKWLKWPQRSVVPQVDYAPGQDTITQNGALNTWLGWGLPNGPMSGDIAPWHHLMSHIFGDDDKARKYFEQWCAYPLQHPGTKMAVAVVIWGVVHGSGKTLIGHTLMRIYGANSVEIKDHDLDDPDNAWAESKQFVLADDITSKGDRRVVRKIMTMITQKQMHINIKYVPKYTVRDLINYLFTSNEPDALYMDDQDRRFFIHEVKAGKYVPYKDYVAWRDSESGAAALWHYLLSLDLAGFEPNEPAPMTFGKRSMIEMGKSELGAWVNELKQNTEQCLKAWGFRGDLFSAQELYIVYDKNGDKRASPNALARELKRAGFRVPGGSEKIKKPDGSTITVYALRNQDYWDAAPWKLACEHYADHRPQLKITSRAKLPVGEDGRKNGSEYRKY